MRAAALPEGAEEGSERSIGVGDDEEERSPLPSVAKLYLGAVYATAIGAGSLVVVVAGGRPSAEGLAAFAVLVVLAAAAQLFRVDAPSQHSYHTTPAFLLAAVLLQDGDGSRR